MLDFPQPTPTSLRAAPCVLIALSDRSDQSARHAPIAQHALSAPSAQPVQRASVTLARHGPRARLGTVTMPRATAHAVLVVANPVAALP